MSRELRTVGDEAGHGRLLLEPPIEVRYRFRVRQWFIEGTAGTLDIDGNVTLLRQALTPALARALSEDAAVQLVLSDGEQVEVNLFGADNLLQPQDIKIRLAGHSDQLLRRIGI